MGWGAAIAGGASLVGGALGAGGSAKAVNKAIGWERERAKNAHQWEVEDLKAAGLNPVLSANGSGATTGSIDATNTMQPLADGINNAVNSASNFQRLENEKEKNKADINNINASTALTNQRAITEAYNQGLISSNTAKAQAESNLIGEKIKQIGVEIQARKAEVENLKARTDLTKYEKQKMIAAVQRDMQEIEKSIWEMKEKPNSWIGATGYDLGRYIGNAVSNPISQMHLRNNVTSARKKRVSKNGMR